MIIENYEQTNDDSRIKGDLAAVSRAMNGRPYLITGFEDFGLVRGKGFLSRIEFNGPEEKRKNRMVHKAGYKSSCS
jgi:hypothetical protein